MKKQLFITYLDQENYFNPSDNYLLNILKLRFDVVIDDDRAELAICDMWGKEHLNCTLPKLYNTAEIYTKFAGLYDIAVNSSLSDDANHYHICYVARCATFEGILNNKIEADIENLRRVKKTKFCAFMYANKYPRDRVVFCKKLQKHREVACLGAVLKNANIPENLGRDRLDWCEQLPYIYKDYKFTIAFENFSQKGWVCEKVFQPRSVGSIPIYWGAPDVAEYLNPKSFINVNDFKDFDAVISHVKDIDNNPELGKAYLDEPMILPNSKLYSQTAEKLADWLDIKVNYVLSDTYIPVGKIKGLKRILHHFDQYAWRKKQRIKYKALTLLEKIGVYY